MPNTITTYYSFQANTKARASQVNSNFSNHRGTNIPINTDTATASNLTHDLGTTEHRWRDLYCESVDIYGATSTLSMQLEGSTSITAGAFNFKIGGTTVAQVLTTGFNGAYIATGTIPPGAMSTPGLRALTITAGGSHTMPSTNFVTFWGCGGGAGGEVGGDSGTVYTATTTKGGAGGGGGGGAMMHAITVPITPNEIVSITIGAGGIGGDNQASQVDVSATSGNATVITGTFGTITFPGGLVGSKGGDADVQTAGSAGFAQFWSSLQVPSGGAGGAGTNNSAGPAGSAGATVVNGAGGAGGAGSGSAASAGGGGGGGRGYGIGGAGGAAATGAGNAGSPGASAAANSGGGGGGGGGAGATGGSRADGGDGGDGGSGIVIVYYIPTT